MGVHLVCVSFTGPLQVEGDSLNVIQWAKGEVAPPLDIRKHHEIHVHCHAAPVTFQHVPRMANDLADLHVRAIAGVSSL
ncbi:hypothetical protein AMTRI_Chr07g28100 [Amborella trichopoda]